MVLLKSKVGFTPGFIFGEDALERESSRLNRLRRVAQKERRTKGSVWFWFNSPLKHYASLLYHDGGAVQAFSFEKHLVGKCAEAAREGRKLRVLDVGVGSGAQWEAFLARHPQLDWHGTSPSRKLVVPSLRDKVIFSTARSLHRKFPPSGFDIVVSSLGVHFQEASAIENAHWLLKPGGEAFIALDSNFTGLWRILDRLHPFFDVLDFSSYNNSMRLRKKVV